MHLFCVSVEAQTCVDCGNAQSGSFYAYQDTILQSGTYNFQEFFIDEGVKVKIKGHSALIINCKEKVFIHGILDASGGSASNPNTNLTVKKGGVPVAGGFAGAEGFRGTSINQAGKNGWGPGGGFGIAGEGGTGAGYGGQGFSCGFPYGAVYGDSLLTQILGGSGGASGSANINELSGSGGAGGGIIVIKSCDEIYIGPLGQILSNGGDGSSSERTSKAGGGGSGGCIFLSAKIFKNEGTISAKGGKGGLSQGTNNCFHGGDGGNGRIRVDAREYITNGMILPIPTTLTLFNAGIRRVVNSKCHGFPSGFIKARASGGKKPYTFIWSNGNQSDELSNLTIGTYTVTISDANGCSVTESATVNEPSEIEISSVVYPPSCAQAKNGQAVFNAKGGTPFPYRKSLYTTLWSNAKSNGIMFDLSSVAKIQLNSISLNIASPSPQTISVYLKSGSMNGAESDSTQWQLISSSIVYGAGAEEETRILLPSLPELNPGFYSIYIYNHDGEINGITSSVIGNTFNFDHILSVYEGIGRNSNTLPFQSGISGIMNMAGKIIYTVNSEKGFSYNYSTPDGNLYQHQYSSGSQEIIISDALGCTQNKIFSIPDADSLKIQSVTTKSPRCSNSNDGEIHITASPASTEFYSISSIPFSNPANGSMLHFKTIENILLKGLDVYINRTGTANIYLKQGNYWGSENNANAWTPLGTYLLTTNSNNIAGKMYFNQAPTLVAGDWSIYIYSTDDIFNQLDSISFNDDHFLSYINSNSKTGNIHPFTTNTKSGSYWSSNIIYSGTSQNLSYQWGNKQNNASLTNISGGNFQCSIQQDAACSVQQNVFLESPAPMEAQSTIHHEVDGNQNGSVTLSMDGGTPPYYIQWLQSGQIGNQIHALPAGIQPFFVSDSHGCTFNDTIHILKVQSPPQSEGQLNISPNPGHGIIRITKAVNGMENCYLNIYDFSGRLILSSETQISALMEYGIDFSHYSDGNYFITVRDEDQVFHAKANLIR